MLKIKKLAGKAKFFLLVVIVVSNLMTLSNMRAAVADASSMVNESQFEDEIVMVEPFENIADKEVQYFQATVPGKIITAQFKKSTHSILEVSFVYSQIDDDISVITEKLINSSMLTNVTPPGVIYENDNIYVHVLNPAYISNAKIKFRVEKAWISSNNIDLESIALYRLKGGVWQRLPTDRIFENESMIVYVATTTAFSPSAIAGKSFNMPMDMPGISPLDTSMPAMFNYTDVQFYLFASGIIGGSLGFVIITLLIIIKRDIVERLL